VCYLDRAGKPNGIETTRTDYAGRRTVRLQRSRSGRASSAAPSRQGGGGGTIALCTSVRPSPARTHVTHAFTVSYRLIHRARAPPTRNRKALAGAHTSSVS